MKIKLNLQQVVALQKKLEEDQELASLLPIHDELTQAYERHKQQFLKSLSCKHEWPTASDGHTYGPMACKHCGLQYHARNKERTLETFEQNYTVTIDIQG